MSARITNVKMEARVLLRTKPQNVVVLLGMKEKDATKVGLYSISKCGYRPNTTEQHVLKYTQFRIS